MSLFLLIWYPILLWWHARICLHKLSEEGRIGKVEWICNFLYTQVWVLQPGLSSVTAAAHRLAPLLYDSAHTSGWDCHDHWVNCSQITRFSNTMPQPDAFPDVTINFRCLVSWARVPRSLSKYYSRGFQEGIFNMRFCVCAKSLQSCLTLCNPMDSLWPARLLCPLAPPVKNTEVSCHFLL